MNTSKFSRVSRDPSKTRHLWPAIKLIYCFKLRSATFLLSKALLCVMENTYRCALNKYLKLELKTFIKQAQIHCRNSWSGLAAIEPRFVLFLAFVWFEREKGIKFTISRIELIARLLPNSAANGSIFFLLFRSNIQSLKWVKSQATSFKKYERTTLNVCITWILIKSAITTFGATLSWRYKVINSARLYRPQASLPTIHSTFLKRNDCRDNEFFPIDLSLLPSRVGK